MQSMIIGQRNMSEEDLQEFDNETVNETRQSSLENLACLKPRSSFDH